jgi:hypothetical protein
MSKFQIVEATAKHLGKDAPNHVGLWDNEAQMMYSHSRHCDADCIVKVLVADADKFAQLWFVHDVLLEKVSELDYEREQLRPDLPLLSSKLLAMKVTLEKEVEEAFLEMKASVSDEVRQAWNGHGRKLSGCTCEEDYDGVCPIHGMNRPPRTSENRMHRAKKAKA